METILGVSENSSERLSFDLIVQCDYTTGLANILDHLTILECLLNRWTVFTFNTNFINLCGVCI